MILKAFIIGICASMPLGPVAILVLQKSLGYGRKVGFVTGLGATTVDTTYSILAIFALAVAEGFIETYEYPLFLIGGIIIAAMGFSMAFRDPFRKLKPERTDRKGSATDYIQAVGLALSNPGAILVMFALFAFFGLEVDCKDFRMFPVVLAVAGGSVTYWFCFSYLFGRIGKAIDLRSVMWLSRVAGIVVMIIGIALFGQGAFQLIFR